MAGAEEHFRPDMGDGRNPVNFSTINGSGKYILVEFPFMSIPERAGETLLCMRQHGLTPILAHPERNGALQKNIDILHKLVDAGCMTQVTAQSLTGELGEPAMKCAYQIVERRLAHVIASDAHSAGSRRPALSDAVEVASMLLGSRAEAAAIVFHTPQAILSGKSVVRQPRAERVREKKKRWWGF